MTNPPIIEYRHPVDEVRYYHLNNDEELEMEDGWCRVIGPENKYEFATPRSNVIQVQ